MTDNVGRVLEYHDGTKHHYHRFARALGYLDWASQPKPFRSFDGAALLPLFPAPGAEPLEAPPAMTYDALYREASAAAQPVTIPALGFFLRHALGLSAWKAYRESRWSLRVNPSSGNLHPTEAYVVARDRLWHYAADRHALEERCVFADAAWDSLGADPGMSFLVALTSIHWREAWKYGERAFRYCQHDLGHAVAALRLSAALCGWRLAILPGWPHRTVASLTGVDREEDYVEAELEDAGCVMLVTAEALPVPLPREADAFVTAVRHGRWSGRASQLSEDHVQWTFIDDVAAATADDLDLPPGPPAPAPGVPVAADRGLDAAAIILQRRSAVAFDSISALDRQAFVAILTRAMPHAGAPWDALWWTPRIHLVLFVHRVNGIAPGVYLLARHPPSEAMLRSAIGREFAWERVVPELPLWLLLAGDHRMAAKRVSCDQDIAADGFFSVGMLAELEGSLREQGAAMYRQLYWESGVVGQVLYLEAEAAGAGGTGIGCFYDDGVHDLLGIRGHSLQSLYHFTVGVPVEDRRLTTQPGYPWS